MTTSNPMQDAHQTPADYFKAFFDKSVMAYLTSYKI